jgi:HAD superfamily hydrolase (TIGR01509 family)
MKKEGGIKLIVFDLDGVLVDAKDIHFDCLNDSLSEIDPIFKIDYDEHLSIYDGLKTNQKLELLSMKKNLSAEHFDRIWKRKQELTLERLGELTPNASLIEALSKLSKNYHIACCSNSIRKTVLKVLSRLEIIHYFDLILSNEDVKNSKPHPEIYWRAMMDFGVLPEETLILEDSPPGLLAAHRSKSNIIRVRNTKDVNIKKIDQKIMEIESNKKHSTDSPKWSDNSLNIIIPMAGAGSRFEAAGFTFPKPLIEVNKKPMIQVVVENINIEANYIFIVQKSHREKYNLDSLLNIISPKCKIIEVDGLTDGAACTALMAKDFINNEAPLFFANSDQFVEWSSNDFMYKMAETNSDGGIVTFRSTHPKWSFAKIDENGFVTEVAEKNPISDLATVGYYFWKHGSDFVKYAEQMIEKNIRVNNEFYVCPVFNQAILDGKKIVTYAADGMWGLGTPEDLEFFIKSI